MIGVGLSGLNLMNQDRTNQQTSSLIGKIFSVKGRNQSKETEVSIGSSEGQYNLPLEPLLSRGVSTKVPMFSLRHGMWEANLLIQNSIWMIFFRSVKNRTYMF